MESDRPSPIVTRVHEHSAVTSVLADMEENADDIAAIVVLYGSGRAQTYCASWASEPKAHEALRQNLSFASRDLLVAAGAQHG